MIQPTDKGLRIGDGDIEQYIAQWTSDPLNGTAHGFDLPSIPQPFPSAFLFPLVTLYRTSPLSSFRPMLHQRK
jgi:hypothetical protein